MSLIKNLALAAAAIGVVSLTAYATPKLSRVKQLTLLDHEMGTADLIKNVDKDSEVETTTADLIKKHSIAYVISGDMVEYSYVKTAIEALCDYQVARAEATAAASKIVETAAETMAAAVGKVDSELATEVDEATKAANDSSKQVTVAA